MGKNIQVEHGLQLVAAVVLVMVSVPLLVSVSALYAGVCVRQRSGVRAAGRLFGRAPDKMI